MAQLIVRKLDDDAEAAARGARQRNGRSLEAEARAILEEAASDEAVAGLLRNDGAKRALATSCTSASRTSGLTEEELRRFNIGIAEINSRWEMRIPDFEADDYEEADSSK